MTTLWEHSMCEHEHRKVRKLPRKMNISSWAGCCRTPKSTKITRKHRFQFLGRMLQRQKRQKSTSFIVKTPVKSIGEHRKVRELPRKTNMEEVEEPKKYQNLQTKPVLDPFNSTADTRKVRELPRKMNIEEVEEPETTKIYRQNPFTPPPENYENSQTKRTCKHETTKIAMNSAQSPVRHLDLATPAFYHYRKNPKCYHTVWGIEVFQKKKKRISDCNSGTFNEAVFLENILRHLQVLCSPVPFLLDQELRPVCQSSH